MLGSILVLEDDETVNRVISFSLSKSGYDVISCYTIEQAKKKIQEQKVDIIICDINLPDGSGLDYISWVRNRGNVYIICLTALDQELDQVMGYEAGADDYITKPFSLSVLLLKVEAYFKRCSVNVEKRVMRSGDITVFLDEMRLVVEGENVQLTRNEWKLISFFLQHPKQVLSKMQILEYIFDIDKDFVDENTLAVNIRRLREKIKDTSKESVYIKNVRGLGYVWNCEVK